MSNTATNRKEISSAIKAILEGVPAVSGYQVGQVHESHRYTRMPEGYKELFTQLVGEGAEIARRVNAWLIHRDSIANLTAGMPTTHQMREHLFIVEGWIGLQDASGSEEAFQDLVDEVCNTFETRVKLGKPGVVEYCYPPQVSVINHAWFGVAPCHHCQIQLRILERRIIEYSP